MSYENKEYILQFFEGVHEEENRAELIEVYRKAKAFDRIVVEARSAEFDIREKESVSSDVRYRTLGKEIARFVSKEEIR